MDTTEENEKYDYEYDNALTYRISRISFIFVSFVIIAGGYTTQLLSCNTQRVLKNNIYVKHLVGIFLIFMFIMLEGGWEFHSSLSNSNINNWSNGNCITSLIFALVLYIIFLLTSKMRFFYTILFFSLLFLLYITNTQRLNYKKKNKISDVINHNIIKIEYWLFWLLPIILIIGVIDYYFYKKTELGKKFNFFTFIIGCTQCKKI